MMKKAIKKLLAALLAVAMLCAMAVPAFAADGATGTGATTGTGSIKIVNTVNGNTYKIYRILDLEYHADTKAYRYTANDTWKSFVETQAEYLVVDTKTNAVTWSANKNNAADIQAFANAAGSYAKAQPIKADYTETADGQSDTGAATDNTTSITFNNLPLGWYLVVSDLNNGAICSIDTTDTTAEIKEKNSKPTIEKHVWENGATLAGYSNDASIGDNVKFVINVAVLDGTPKNYVVHDKMSAGLTFNEDSVNVSCYRPTEENPYTPIKLTKDTDYQLITTGLSDKCTFEVQLSDNFLKPGDMIMVEYYATVNENAVIGGEGNDNDTYLKYGNDSKTEHSTTKTYVWEMGVHKYTNLGTGKEDTALADAEFKLYKGADANKKYASFSTANTVDGTSVYKLTGWVADAGAATAVVTPASGNIKLEGLDAGTYYLEETKAPVGYNKLTDPITVVIDRGTLPTKAGESVSYTVKYGNTTAADHIVRVENKAGVELPSTGGMGTTLFYVIGGGLMVAAIVLLVTKKRMENK
ncbi:isopeptide-forming domain-containing fimbrial protein [Faecalibacterium sp. OF03-6AC]|uniref:SpaH/EbpB family LPXTG-anchored major pilin n=1 Tax=Faecalibacterium TaxID=216851 RepID=UPI000E51E046|nr:MULTISPECIES: SpaH/EbpB family LPXTG-anchored major pilin [Faecalibacterium]RHP61514.1 isopeptide-forming domain-containing fimbrial protein [Faecalibacterium sp. OF03-6AC]